MTAPVSESPSAESEGIVAPASSLIGGQRMHRGSQGGIQHAPATRLAATGLAAEPEAASPMCGGETPVKGDISATIVDSADPLGLALIPAPPQMEPDEASAYITVAQTSRDTIRRLGHAVTCKISIAKESYRSAELAAAWPPSSKHASRTVS